MSDPRQVIEQRLGWVLLALLLGGCFLVLLPFLSALLWGAILSYATWPLYTRVLRRLGGRRTVAALVMALAMIAVILLPALVLGATLTDNVRDLTTSAEQWIEAGPPPPPAWLAKVPIVGGTATESWKKLAADRGRWQAQLRRAVEVGGTALLKLGWMLGNGLLQIALSILITFFLLRNGPAVAETLTTAVERVARERGRHLLMLAGATMRGVVYGVLGTALLQAVMAALGLLVAGAPWPGLLALGVFFFSVVPAGPFLVMAPAALWLFHQGSNGWGIFLLVWAVGVGTVDNFVRPWLISQGSDMPFVLILLGVLGGALTFGFIGVFIGPTLLAVGHRIVTEWAATHRPGLGRTSDQMRVGRAPVGP